MINKDFIEKIEELSEPKLVEVDGEKFCKHRLTHIQVDKHPDPAIIYLSSLQSLLEYIEGKNDDAEKYLIIANTPTNVSLYGEYLSDFGRRNNFVVCIHDELELPISSWTPQTEFIIKLNTLFSETPDLERLIHVVSNIADVAQNKFDDDGISQEVTMRAGIERLSKETVKNPFMLKPYRTFYEIDQIESPFILRIDKGESGIEFNLFDSDGGIWQSKIISSIKEYLKTELVTLSDRCQVI